MGDSAGGNLICSMMNYLYAYDVKAPSKLFLFYPGFLISSFNIQELCNYEYILGLHPISSKFYIHKILS